MAAESEATIKNTVSVVILTHNSTAKLRDCLESVRWASEIIVVDDESTDNTVALAGEYTDRVIVRKWDIEGRHRNAAYDLATSDYILSLDSDERVTPELQGEILALMREGFRYDCYNISHRNYIGNFWIRNGGFYPNAKLKLFKKKLPIYEETEPHPRMLIMGDRFTLRHDILHLNYDNISHLIRKLNSQTTQEARKWIQDKRRMSTGRCIRKAVDRFFRAYLLKKGYRDGFTGVLLAMVGSLYQIMSYAKYRELLQAERAPVSPVVYEASSHR